MHTQNTHITYADTLNSNKGHSPTSLGRLADHSQAVQTANGLPPFMLINCDIAKNINDNVYFCSTEIKSCQGGTPAIKL